MGLDSKLKDILITDSLDSFAMEATKALYFIIKKGKQMNSDRISIALRDAIYEYDASINRFKVYRYHPEAVAIKNRFRLYYIGNLSSDVLEELKTYYNRQPQYISSEDDVSYIDSYFGLYLDRDKIKIICENPNHTMITDANHFIMFNRYIDWLLMMDELELKE